MPLWVEGEPNIWSDVAAGTEGASEPHGEQKPEHSSVLCVPGPEKEHSEQLLGPGPGGSCCLLGYCAGGGLLLSCVLIHVRVHCAHRRLGAFPPQLSWGTWVSPASHTSVSAQGQSHIVGHSWLAFFLLQKLPVFSVTICPVVSQKACTWKREFPQNCPQSETHLCASSEPVVATKGAPSCLCPEGLPQPQSLYAENRWHGSCLFAVPSLPSTGLALLVHRCPPWAAAVTMSWMLSPSVSSTPKSKAPRSAMPPGGSSSAKRSSRLGTTPRKTTWPRTSSTSRWCEGSSLASTGVRR